MCFAAIVKANNIQYNTDHHLQSGYHGDTRRTALIIRTVGKGPENKQREIKSDVWVKWGKEIKGGHREVNMAACGIYTGFNLFDV